MATWTHPYDDWMLSVSMFAMCAPWSIHNRNWQSSTQPTHSKINCLISCQVIVIVLTAIVKHREPSWTFMDYLTITCHWHFLWGFSGIRVFATEACERAHEWQRALLIFQQVEAGHWFTRRWTDEQLMVMIKQLDDCPVIDIYQSYCISWRYRQTLKSFQFADIKFVNCVCVCLFRSVWMSVFLDHTLFDCWVYICLHNFLELSEYIFFALTNCRAAAMGTFPQWFPYAHCCQGTPWDTSGMPPPGPTAGTHHLKAKNHSSASFCSVCTALSRAERWKEAVQLMSLGKPVGSDMRSTV